ncbi:MAG: enoyl-CoA hydratase/isomerase family protein [Burkholderiaceae bacterium]|nr:MAG: enoyl-CoA hydratase/isomerase family protein [Burkholderiaceae bacterium]TAM05955.1 MAG: enoyl-CoA hydratase/isomerase family protein [Pusillimonas sp.]
MDESVVFEMWSTVSKQKVAVATLNRPASLNSLTLEMVQSLTRQLRMWERDGSIAMVVLKGAGEKAFCAGGDIRQVYESVVANVTGRPWDNAYARAFFETEYRLDYLIHTYMKPVLCWGSGIVMGGGAGLMMGASHRITCETTRFAMPEVTIGIYPDAGGTWMLSRLAPGIGVFLALTGTQLGASDCQFLGLADYFLDSSRWADLRSALETQAWSDSRDENDVVLHQVLLSLRTTQSLPPGPLRERYSRIAELCAGPDFEAICDRLLALADTDDAWLRQAATTFRVGAPGSARLSFTLLRSVHAMSLADIFRQEYMVSLQCAAMGDFQEGVRALIVDKDKAPRWNPHTRAGASQDWVRRFFVPAWPDSILHPMADLGVQVS